MTDEGILYLILMIPGDVGFMGLMHWAAGRPRKEV